MGTFAEPVHNLNRPRRPAARPDPDSEPPQPSHELAREEPGKLASKLASKHAGQGEPGGGQTAEAPVLTVLDLLSMRDRPVDPYADYAPDGTRQLKWIQDAVALVADMTGNSRQEVYRDALLGVRPLPADILDACYLHRYGQQRKH